MTAKCLNYLAFLILLTTPVTRVQSLKFNFNTQSDDDRTNFIVMQPDDLSHLNYEASVTFPPRSNLPNIERLCTEGVQMMQAYTTSSACGTSRYSTMTGRYPSRSAYSRHVNSGNHIQEVTIPNTKVQDVWISSGEDCSKNNLAAAMKSNDYTTGIVGKWHLTFNGSRRYDDIVDDIKSCGFDYAEAIYPENLQKNWNHHDASHNIEYVTHKAIEFINDADDPFFLYVNPTAPHFTGSVYDVLSGSHDCTDTPEGKVKPFFVPGMFGPGEKYATCQEYRDSVLERGDYSQNNNELGSIWVDDSVGAILQALEENDKLDNTFFLFQMDHGQEGKFWLYETGVRIAQFVHYPDEFGTRGREFSGLVSTMDIAPTILDYAGAGTTPYDMDGQSWKGVVKNDDRSSWDDRCLVFEMDYDRAVRCQCFKYITGPWYDDELYNLCDEDGNYITAVDGTSPEQTPVNDSDQQRRLSDMIQCHLDSTDPDRDPDYFYQC